MSRGMISCHLKMRTWVKPVLSVTARSIIYPRVFRYHTFTAVCFSTTSKDTCRDISGMADRNCTNKNIRTVWSLCGVPVWFDLHFPCKIVQVHFKGKLRLSLKNSLFAYTEIRVQEVKIHLSYANSCLRFSVDQAEYFYQHTQSIHVQWNLTSVSIQVGRRLLSSSFVSA